MDRPQQTGVTPMYIAAQNGHTAVVTELVAADADVNAGKAVHCTPLLTACQHSFADIVRVLLERGKADSTITTADGASALYVACQFDNLAEVEVLLQHGAAVNFAKAEVCPPSRCVLLRDGPPVSTCVHVCHTSTSDRRTPPPRCTSRAKTAASTL